MGVLAGDEDVEPALAEGAFDRADGDPLGLEDGPLLDVGFEVGGERRRGVAPGEADRIERVADAAAFAVALRQAVLQGERARVDARAHHHRREAAAFLVRPDGDVDRVAGADAVVIEAAQDFEPRQDTVGAVEASAVGLGVEMAAHADRIEVLGPGAGGVDVADGVDADPASAIAQPVDHEAARFAIELR